MNGPNINNYSEHVKEKFFFMEELGFAYSIDDHHITYEKGDDRLELWFDFYGFEISCLLCKGKERLHLFNAIRYFGYDTYGFYHMYHSYKQIPEVIDQFVGYVKELVCTKNIFDKNVFSESYLNSKNNFTSDTQHNFCKNSHN